MNAKPPKEDKHPVSTWLSTSERDKLVAIAAHHNVSIAAFIRGVLVDVIAEDIMKLPPSRKAPKVE